MRHKCRIIILRHSCRNQEKEMTTWVKKAKIRKTNKRKSGLSVCSKGFKNVTMKDICAATGLSRGGLYRHYDSTRQIFLEIIEALMGAQDNELTEKMNAGLPASQILNEILERYRKEMLDNAASLSVAIYEFFSENYSIGQDNLLLKQYQYSVDMWNEFYPME